MSQIPAAFQQALDSDYRAHRRRPPQGYADDTGWAGGGADITRIYRRKLVACTYEVLPG